MIYLNNAYTSFPKPSKVLDGLGQYIQGIPFHSKRSGLQETDNDIPDQARQSITHLLNAGTSNTIVFTSGATESLNLVIKGLPLKGKHVIITAIEHNSSIRPVKELERQGILELSVAPCDKFGKIDPQDIESLITPKTSLIIISHASNVTGRIQDIDTISAIAHQNNALLLVDASQTIGSLAIDVQNSAIDMLAFTGHKWLFGLQGIGGLYLREGLRLEPLKTGGTGIKSNYLYQPDERPLLYEAGTPNVVGILSMKSGIEYIISENIEVLSQKNRKNFIYLIEELSKINRVHLFVNSDVNQHMPIVSFTIDGFSVSDVAYILETTYHIIIRHGLHCAPLIHHYLGTGAEGTIRVSPSVFTKFEDLEQFIIAIKNICNNI